MIRTRFVINDYLQASLLHIRRLKVFDWASILLAVLLISITSIFAFANQENPGTVLVQIRGVDYRYSLDRKRIISPKIPGECTISIAESKVSVVESECPERICVRRGEIGKVGEWIACVPHRVFISIDGIEQTSIDDISY